MEPERTSTQAGESTAGGESRQLPPPLSSSASTTTTSMRPQGPPETAIGSGGGSHGSLKLSLIHQDIFLNFPDDYDLKDLS